MVMAIVITTPEMAAKKAAEITVATAKRIIPFRRFEKGCATGNTPIGYYKEVIAQGKAAGLDFSRIRTWNLDEYEGLGPDHPLSYRYFMAQHLHDPAGILPAHRRFPDFNNPATYDSALKMDTDGGGIDLGILGIGRTGHIGFDEPGSPRDSITRVVDLHETTIDDAVREFGDRAKVPRRAVTMGVDTILRYYARIFLFAYGPSKAGPIRDMIHGEIGPHCPASFLREHRDVTVFLDPPSASKLDLKGLQITYGS